MGEDAVDQALSVSLGIVPLFRGHLSCIHLTLRLHHWCHGGLHGGHHRRHWHHSLGKCLRHRCDLSVGLGCCCGKCWGNSWCRSCCSHLTCGNRLGLRSLLLRKRWLRNDCGNSASSSAWPAWIGMDDDGRERRW